MLTSLLGISFLQNYSFSFFAVLAFAFGSFAFWKKAREEHYDDTLIVDMMIGSLFWGLLTARVVHVLIHLDTFGFSPFLWLSIWSHPGLHWVGLYVGSFVIVYKFCREHKWDVFKTLDLGVIGLSLSQSLTNLGVFLSGAAVGKVTKLPLGVIFPNTFEPRHPVGLYGFVLWLLMFFTLWWLEGKYRRFIWYQKVKGESLPGFLFFSYIIALGVIGAIVVGFSEATWQFYGVNIDLVFRVLLILLGSVALFSRSGLAPKSTLLSNFSIKKK